MLRDFWKELQKWKNENEQTPLMVIGARQIGKTYIIDEFCKENYEDYIYINLMEDKGIIEIFDENINTEDKIKKMELYLNHTIKENTIIFFDEIQKSESLIESLKYFCEAKFPYKIICAGSLLGIKLKRFNKSFPVGKVIIKYMYPMTFEEFLMAIGYSDIIEEIKKCFSKNEKMSNPIHEKLLNYYRLFLATGGMPIAVKNIIDNNLNVLEFNNDLLESIISAYFADMKEYTLNYYENIKIEKIYRNIPSQLAKENKKFQISKIEKYARRRDYESSLDWLIASNLVIPCHFVEKFETPLKGFMDEEKFKLYLSDTGLLTELLEIPRNKMLLNEDFQYKGVITENYVANELHANNISLYYWAKNQVAEIDFLIDTCDGVIPIEVKANENKKSKSLNYFMDNNKVNYGIRISANNFGFTNNIKSVPLYATFCIKKDKENN